MAALSLPAPGWAQAPPPPEPSTADKDQARALMDQGVEREEAKDYAAALRAFQAAHTLVGFPMTGLAVARAQAGLGLLLEALESATQAKNNPIRPNESPAFAKARSDAEAFAQSLAARIPSLQVTVEGPSGGAEVSIDGVAIPASAVNQPRKVNPGKHVITATAPGYEPARLEVEAPEGQVTPATVTMTPASGGGSDGPSGPGEGKSGGLSPLVFVGFGVGAAGLIAGTVTGALSLSKTSSIEKDCTNGVCPASLAEEISGANTLANVSNISLAVGVAGAAVGVVGLLFLSGGSGEKKPAAASSGIRIKPAIGPGSISIIGVF